jgi:F0F1-type ATP synthase assembly protein I
MLKERMKIKQAREKAARIAEAERKKLSAQRLFAAQLIGGAIVVVIFGVIIILIIRQATS